MNNTIKPKKSLGQHFLKDDNIALQIVQSLHSLDKYDTIIEIGPGMGVLSKHLMNLENKKLFFIEKDAVATEYFEENFPLYENNIIQTDFLTFNLDKITNSPFAIIGNFPYNISSQILFRVLEYRNLIPEVVGMFQKEVAERIISKHNNKVYGILSVLMQTFYDIEYLFTVDEDVFNPRPKVKSAVLRFKRNQRLTLDCNEVMYFKVIKTAFNQRRKMLRNALKTFEDKLPVIDSDILTKRAENLTVEDFIKLTNCISNNQ